MSIDLQAAASFVATHARILDRRRFQLLRGDGGGDRGSVLAALDAYRNLDGGFGWGLEPDLRSAESQPAAAMHAFEVLAEAAPATTPRAVELCDWLNSISLADGALPFALPLGDPAGCAPFWAQVDPTISSLHMTAAVAAKAHHVARQDAAVAGHPWLGKATAYCLDAIGDVDAAPPAYELSFALQFLDAIADTHPQAAGLLNHLGRHIPRDGLMHVQGGTDDETLRALDFAPAPDRPVRGLLDPSVIAAELGRLTQQQRPDGGWSVDWVTSSPAAALEWSGYVTVRAVAVLRANESR
jgi:hypothetical protein